MRVLSFARYEVEILFSLAAMQKQPLVNTAMGYNCGFIKAAYRSGGTRTGNSGQRPAGNP